MANNILNVITIDKMHSDMFKEIQMTVSSNQRGFDFGQIIPMPVKLRGQTDQGDRAWYSWCTTHWGTKKNAYDMRILSNGFVFQTAWDHPYPIVKKLSEMFPSIVFQVMYADEDLGNNMGVYSIQDGSVDDEWHSTIEDMGVALSIAQTLWALY